MILTARNHVPNVYFTYDSQIDIHKNGAPEYGDAADDNSLEALMANTLDPAAHASVDFYGLKPGTTYNFYVLAANNTLAPDVVSNYYLHNDAFGSEQLDESGALNLTELQGGSIGTGVLIHMQGVASADGTLTFGVNTGPDGTEHPYMSAAVLTEVPAIPATVIIGTSIPV
jgi:hypothetical protein